MANDIAGLKLGENFFRARASANGEQVSGLKALKDGEQVSGLKGANSIKMLTPTIVAVGKDNVVNAISEIEKNQQQRISESQKPLEVEATKEVEPSFYEKNKTMIFVGAGIGVVVIIGVVVYFKTRQQTT